MLQFIRHWVIIIMALLSGASAFSCLNEDGNPVDSWNAIKPPDNITYYYYDAPSKSYQLSPYTVNQTLNGAIMGTVLQLYQYPNDIDYIAYGMYNDEPPPDDTASSTYAHAKGLLVTNESKSHYFYYLSS